MLPRWHIFWGGILSALIWILFPNIAWYNLILLFLASFLIDFDHYMCFVWKKHELSLFKAFKYHDELQRKEREATRRGIRLGKGDFHIFHTLEFHALVFALGFIFQQFFYVVAGMAFHSILDIISLIKEGTMHRREFFLANWLIRTKVP